MSVKLGHPAQLYKYHYYILLYILSIINFFKLTSSYYYIITGKIIEHLHWLTRGRSSFSSRRKWCLLLDRMKEWIFMKTLSSVTEHRTKLQLAFLKLSSNCQLHVHLLSHSLFEHNDSFVWQNISTFKMSQWSCITDQTI